MKMGEVSIMTRREIYEYWYPAMKTIFDTILRDDCMYDEFVREKSALMGKALGADYYCDWLHTSPMKENPLPEEVRHKLVMLAGPHGKTIYKAMLARRK